MEHAFEPHESFMRLVFVSSVLLLAGLLAEPAFAAQSTPLPEPSAILLLGLGIAGVALGRRFSRRDGED